MNKKLISIAVGAALTAGTVVAQAADDMMPTTYGKIHLSYGQVKRENAAEETTTDNIQMNSHASRLGFKGSLPVNDSLKATYKVEYGLSNFGGTGTTGLSNRNQYVGLKGGFGEVRFGRHDTPVKMAQGKFDEFNDTFGDWAGIVEGDKRLNNSILYLSPNWGGFSFDFQIAPGEGSGETNEAGDGPADHISGAVEFSKAGFFVSYGYEIYDDSNPRDALGRLVLSYGNKMFQVAGFSEAVVDAELDDDGNVTTGSNDKASIGLSGHVSFADVHKIAAQYVTGTTDEGGTGTEDLKETEISLGYYFKMGKSTTAYALYNTYEADNGNTAPTDTNLVIGMIQKF
jgi:predicted porin